MTYQRIILIGYRATGKTSTATALAEALKWRCFDSDIELAKDDGRDITTIFKEDGELEFRRRESEILRRLVQESGAVIATGGGAILSEANRKLLKEAGPVFWLIASADVIRQRLAADQETIRSRPALSSQDVISEVEDVLAERARLYKACADYEVATDELTPRDVAKKILNLCL